EEREASAKGGFDREGDWYVAGRVGSLQLSRFSLCLTTPAKQPAEPTLVCHIMSSHRIRSKEMGVMHDVGFARLRSIERRRINHRDIVVGTSDSTIATPDAHVILEIDFSFGAP